MTPAITFIIPAHDAAKTLSDTLNSLLTQSRGDWFALVIDDGSTDATAEVAGSFHDPRVRVIHQGNMGVAATRNRGLAMAVSPAVCFVDADDTVEPGFVERMLPALEGYDIAPAAYRYVGPGLEDANWVISPAADDPARLIEFNQYAIGAMVFNRESLIAHAGAAPFPTTSRQEDWEVLLRLREVRWAPPISTVMFSYRLRPDSRTTALWEIWRDGLNLIARSHADPTARAVSLRRWTIRSLGRAATTADQDLCHTLFEHLDRLTAFDTDTLAGALRWSMRRAAVAGEAPSLLPRHDWHNQILATLGNDDIARDALRRASTPDWSQVAAAAAARLGPNQTLVVYGAGRNGRELIDHLAARRIPLAIIDDNPAALAPSIPRVAIDDLSPNHLILITPDDRSGILSRLGKGRDAQILLPEQLVA